jgi:predicted transcriptional regulator
MIHQQNIRVWRAKLALSQMQLGQEADIPQSRISRAEQGLIRLSDAEMSRISAVILRKRKARPRRAYM